MKEIVIRCRPAIRRRSLLIAAGLYLVLTGCAAKNPPTFFPDPPAPPRVQLLTSFNNQGSLRNNAAMSFIAGEEVGDKLSKAFGLAFHNGQLYIADSGKSSNGVAVVDFEKKTLDFIHDNVRKPFNLAIDKDGTLYVTDLGEDIAPSIVVFDAQHRYLKHFSFDPGSEIRPIGLLIVGDELYICGSSNNQIYVLNKHTGEVVRTIAPDPILGYPVYLSRTPDGNILVTETLAQTLRLLSPAGDVLDRIGKPGDRAGNFVRPKATAVDHDGYIYTVDTAFQNVQIFNSTGQVMMVFGSLDDPKKTLVMPAGIAINYDRMDIFQPYAAPGFKLDYVIAVSSQGAPPNKGSKITLYGFGKMQGADYTPPTKDE